MANEKTKTEVLLKDLAVHLGYGSETGISDLETEKFALDLLDACKQAKREIAKSHRSGLATDAISGYFEECGREVYAE